MTSPHLDENDEALVAYLYDECEVEERRRIEQHLAECARCATEVDDMRSVRGALAEWSPPETKLGFRVVADPAPPRRWWAGGALPVWAQAAAAVFLFAAGAAVSQLDVRYASGGLTVRPRWVPPAGAVAQAPADTRPVPVPAVSPKPANAVVVQPASATAQAEQTLRRDLEGSARPGTAASSARDEEALLRRVQALIEQSEQRQQRELALRLAQVVRDFDAQRQADLVRVEQNLGQLEGQTGAAVAQQRELLNYLVRVSQQP